MKTLLATNITSRIIRKTEDAETIPEYCKLSSKTPITNSKNLVSRILLPRWYQERINDKKWKA